jgi:hypothetical protein
MSRRQRSRPVTRRERWRHFRWWLSDQFADPVLGPLLVVILLFLAVLAVFLLLINFAPQ